MDAQYSLHKHLKVSPTGWRQAVRRIFVVTCMMTVWKQYPIEEDVAYHTDFTFISQTRSERILIRVSKTVCGDASTSAP